MKGKTGNKNHAGKGRKKGVSIMIGYVLLVALAVTMGVVAYSWMSTYLPKSISSCPEGVSLLIKDYSCQPGGQFSITLKNNGRFDVAGYIIRAGNPSEAVASKDISLYATSGETKVNNVLIYSAGQNFLKAGDERASSFSVTGSGLTGVGLIEITPTRFQEEGNRKNFVICTDSVLTDLLSSCSLQ
jgi:FlaG/FlaF family flagellin (archaellin)